MTQLDGAVAALVSAAGVYGVLAVLWVARSRSDRAAAASLGRLDIDPYHAVATAGQPYDADEHAAAVLLLAGRLRIGADGQLSVADGGSHGAGSSADAVVDHPVAAALLDAVRRNGPVTLRRLRDDPGLREARGTFLREQDARVPRWSGRRNDGIGTTACATALALSSFFPVQRVFLGDEKPAGVGDLLFGLFLVVITGLMLAVPLVWLAMRYWPDRRDPFRAHCAGLPHPEPAALDEERRGRLRESRVHAEPRAREDTTWVDSGGAF
ncbi:hypothetical protein AB0C40_15920 [Streptomyces brevispora]|uniref:hypothetical protein n=1 Tax=Streptomyces brevispora TaxID=887462 RepID=UPI0033F82F7F